MAAAAAGVVGKPSPQLAFASSKKGVDDLRPQSLKSTGFLGSKIVLPLRSRGFVQSQTPPIQMGYLIGKAHRWWEKDVQPNMREITCARDLVESLLNAGDRLVVVDYFSPACGGCRTLHPKICQFAGMNPDIQFLQVNHEAHKSMCYSLRVHVLPFFTFYRGAHGRVCNFSCTTATIKKFRDALAKHTPDRCTLGPPKGLEESELLALAANPDLDFTYTPKPKPKPKPKPEALPELEEPVPVPAEIEDPTPAPAPAPATPEEKTLVGSHGA